jgi:hypothetical protein
MSYDYAARSVRAEQPRIWFDFETDILHFEERGNVMILATHLAREDQDKLKRRGRAPADMLAIKKGRSAKEQYLKMLTLLNSTV